MCPKLSGFTPCPFQGKWSQRKRYTGAQNLSLLLAPFAARKRNKDLLNDEFQLECITVSWVRNPCPNLWISYYVFWPLGGLQPEMYRMEPPSPLKHPDTIVLQSSFPCPQHALSQICFAIIYFWGGGVQSEHLIMLSVKEDADFQKYCWHCTNFFPSALCGSHFSPMPHANVKRRWLL